MRLNTLAPTPGSQTAPKRLGRGIGSGLGKTSGKGHKGQYARAGGYHKVGFEGGQMPMQRRLPKFGFTSMKALSSEELRLDQLKAIEGDVVDLISLRAAGLIRYNTQFVKIIGSGELTRKLTVHGIAVTKGARQAVEKAGGKIEV
jgi:large subunit ribosomal protein L15